MNECGDFRSWLYRPLWGNDLLGPDATWWVNFAVLMLCVWWAGRWVESVGRAARRINRESRPSD